MCVNSSGKTQMQVRSSSQACRRSLRRDAGRACSKKQRISAPFRSATPNPAVVSFLIAMPIKSTEKAQRTLVLPGDQARDIVPAPGDYCSPAWKSDGHEPRVCRHTGFAVPVFPLLHDLRFDTCTGTRLFCLQKREVTALGSTWLTLGTSFGWWGAGSSPGAPIGDALPTPGPKGRDFCSRFVTEVGKSLSCKSPTSYPAPREGVSSPGPRMPCPQAPDHTGQSPARPHHCGSEPPMPE